MKIIELIFEGDVVQHADGEKYNVVFGCGRFGLENPDGYYVFPEWENCEIVGIVHGV